MLDLWKTQYLQVVRPTTLTIRLTPRRIYYFSTVNPKIIQRCSTISPGSDVKIPILISFRGYCLILSISSLSYRIASNSILKSNSVNRFFCLFYCPSLCLVRIVVALGKCLELCLFWLKMRVLILSSQNMPVWLIDISASCIGALVTLVNDSSESECIAPLLALILLPFKVQQYIRNCIHLTKLHYKPTATQQYKESSQTTSFLFVICHLQNQLIMKPNENKYHQSQTKYVHSLDTKKNNANSNKSKVSLNDVQSRRVLEQVQKLIAMKQNVQGINLLRALKQNMQNVKNTNLIILTIVNLAILYYQVGFLQQANLQFALAITKLKELSGKLVGVKNKEGARIKYQTMLGKIQLQVCILYSQLGKHDMALEHAKNSSKINYNLIHDILTCLHSRLNKILIANNYPKNTNIYIQLDKANDTVNSIAVLNHLISSTKDLKLAFLQKQRIAALEEECQVTRKYGLIGNKIDIELLYASQQKTEGLWIYKSKILDQIQLLPYPLAYFDNSEQISNNEIISKIAFLAISLYCYSTQTRFMESNKISGSNDVLDSEHWLSRSLEIAYSFMPPEAPILNQILTVHDRFHGLDKQTIPEDEEVTGFFKVLRPLTKPTTTYTSKTACSPIMIRIQAEKIDLPTEPPAKTHRELPKNTIQLDTERTLDVSVLGRNNRIRGYSQAHKRIETPQPIIERFIHSRPNNESPLLINGNIRSNFVSRKFQKSKEDKLKLNFTELHGKALISEDLLSRPQTIEERHDQQDSFRSNSQRKKKSLPSRKVSIQNKERTANTIKYEGMLLKGHKMEQPIIESDLFQRFHDTKILQSARIGGNVYINNNINFYISKNAESNPYAKTYLKSQGQGKRKQEKELDRRQIFLNKRRANNFIEEIES